MATWADVRRVALALPESAETIVRGTDAWKVRGVMFVWDRPLRKADAEALGDAAPDGPVLGARVANLEAKDALIAEDPEVYFTIPHFDGYPAVLVRLEEIKTQDLSDLIIEAWLCRAPKRVAAAYLKGSAR
ncbi:MAG TPA: hypothetical protein VGX23_20820 [Actinocrinis sp.]|nr:hypothetical protein [Actinocrinis sp.]